MASKFQNRLVGTVILVALVVIFLPDLLDGQKLAQQEEAFAKIPLRPDLAPAKPALQVSAATPLPAEHQASQQQAAAAQQWQVEEIADPVTPAGQGSSTQPATVPAQQTAAITPPPKPAPKPEVVAKKPVEPPKPAPAPAAKPTPVKPVEVVKAPPPAKPQAGQIKSLDDLIESKMNQPITPAPVAVASQGSWVSPAGGI